MSECTWEPKKNLDGCPDLIRKFEESLKPEKEPPKKVNVGVAPRWRSRLRAVAPVIPPTRPRGRPSQSKSPTPPKVTVPKTPQKRANKPPPKPTPKAKTKAKPKRSHMFTHQTVPDSSDDYDKIVSFTVRKGKLHAFVRHKLRKDDTLPRSVFVEIDG
jgi:cell division septation protein DedD